MLYSTAPFRRLLGSLALYPLNGQLLISARLCYQTLVPGLFQMPRDGEHAGRSYFVKKLRRHN